MDHTLTNPPPPYTSSPTLDAPLLAHLDRATSDMKDMSERVVPTHKSLKANIAAYPKNKNITLNKPNRDKILRDFTSLTTSIQEFQSQHGALADINGDAVTDGLARRKLKLCQYVLESLKGDLQVHLTNMKKAGVLKPGEAREMEEEVGRKCGVEIGKGGKTASADELIQIAVFG
jgi:hypothetical protein